MSADPRPLGASGIVVSPLGVGTNRWGTSAAAPETLSATYRASLDAGVDFFDTAEIYAGGKSEKALGECAREDSRPAILASKFAPLPMRLTTAQFMKALDRTLARMGRESIDLYYLHFPYSPVGVGTWMKGMAEAVRSGKIRAVGVSNCGPGQMRRAADVLGRHDIPLAANQVQYSVVHRKPEQNGVLDACRAMNVALVAYRPLRGGQIKSGADAKQSALFGVMTEIAGSGRSLSQVALRWLLQRDEHVIPIPGATKPHHAEENAAALKWSLTTDELEALDKASA